MRIEPMCRDLGVQGAGQRRGDIRVVRVDQRVCIEDVSTVYALAPSYVRRASKRDGVCAATRETDKQAVYSDLVGQGGADFVPIAVELHGRWGEAALARLRQLAATASGEPHNLVLEPLGRNIMHSWLVELSCTLLRHLMQGFLFRASKPALARRAASHSRFLLEDFYGPQPHMSALS